MHKLSIRLALTHREPIRLAPTRLPLTRLQGNLWLKVPRLARKRSLPFVPHFTLAHFDSLSAAEAAGDALTFEPVEFDVDAVHLLEREGHQGQFEVVEKVPLGCAPLWRLRRLFRRKRRFVGMPAEPPDWVADAMAERSSRRFRGRGKRRRKRRSAAERAEIAARTPEDIAAIRAERRAKRLAKEEADESSDS